MDDPARREAIYASFVRCNDAARALQANDHRALYSSLKLDGLREAPVQFAVFCDASTSQGRGLGRMTMPETLTYSVVGAIATFWLAARAEGLGVGWLSILDPREVHALVEVDPAWQFVAYLCVGWPEQEHLDPELERHGWQPRTDAGRKIIHR